MNQQEAKLLQTPKFTEYCKVLGLKELCCLEPDRRAIEKGFRKKALRSHPDKGGDPIEFKRINDAYNRLIGHIEKLSEQAEAIELANSILIEVSKGSVLRWQEKLKNKYGWFKTANCKNIIFDGPYKQYMGRSKNTGNLTVVLYEDPPDGVPKLHVRTSKYMAWIAEQGLPTHMHVGKGRALQFDQWRIAHLADFGIINLKQSTETPIPPRKDNANKKESKAKRKEREESENNRTKTRRDSQPTPDLGRKMDTDKENTEPETDVKSNESDKYSCPLCGTGFSGLLDYITHKTKCSAKEETGKSEEKSVNNNADSDTNSCNGLGEQNPTTESNNGKNHKDTFDAKLQDLKDSFMNIKETKCRGDVPIFQCEICKITFTNMVWYTKHKNQNDCLEQNSEDPRITTNSRTQDKDNKKSEISADIPEHYNNKTEEQTSKQKDKNKFDRDKTLSENSECIRGVSENCAFQDSNCDNSEEILVKKYCSSENKSTNGMGTVDTENMFDKQQKNGSPLSKSMPMESLLNNLPNDLKAEPGGCGSNMGL